VFVFICFVARNEKVRISNNELLFNDNDMKIHQKDDPENKNCPLWIKNNSGKTPIDLAREYHQDDIQKLFYNYFTKLNYAKTLSDNNMFVVIFHTQRLGFVLTTTPDTNNNDGDNDDNCNDGIGNGGSGVIVSNVRNELYKDKVFVGDEIVSIGNTNVLKQSINFVTNMVLNADRPIAITFYRRHVQKQQQRNNNNNSNSNKSSTMTPKSISLLSPLQAQAPPRCHPDEEDIAHDVVFYTQRLGLNLQTKPSTGEIYVKDVTNDEYNDTIFPGDVMVSAGDMGPLEHKSMKEVSTFIMSSKRPLTVRFKRPYRNRLRDGTIQLAVKKSSSTSTEKQRQHQKLKEVPDDGSHSLREVLNILSPEILSDSIKSDDDEEVLEEETHVERQSRLKSEAKAYALKKAVEPPSVTTTAAAVPPSIINEIRYVNTKMLYNCPLCNKTFRSKDGLKYHTVFQVCILKPSARLNHQAEIRSAPVEYDLAQQSPASSSLSSPEGVTIPGIGIATSKERVAAAAGTTKNSNRNPASNSNDTINKKLEGRGGGGGGGDHPLFHPLHIADTSQSVVSNDFQNVAHASGLAHASGPTVTTTMTAKEEGDAQSSTARGGKFDMYPDVALSEQEEEEFPLHACVKFGFLDFLEEELRKDTAVVNAVDTHGRTALDLAALTGQLILVNRLRQAGGIFRYKNGPRMAALANNRSKEMEKYLKAIRTSVG
jgi:hypothetical protein